eukprot:696028-Prorocentrum_minimum.AAC.1
MCWPSALALSRDVVASSACRAADACHSSPCGYTRFREHFTASTSPLRDVAVVKETLPPLRTYTLS